MDPLISSRQPGHPLALRDWYWSLTLLGYHGRRQWLSGARHVAARPYLVARRTLAAVREFGPGVKRRFGAGLVRQATLLWWDSLRYSLRPGDWYRNQLYLASERHRAPLIIPTRVNFGLLAALDGGVYQQHARTIGRKERFAKWCRANGFPTAEIVGTITVERDVDAASLPRCDLFTKRTRGSGGQGAALWRWDGDGRWIGDDGRPRDGRELVAELQAQAGPGWGILIQRRLRNHPTLEPLARRALCTARMMTIRWPDGRIEHGCTIFRIPLGDSPVDNMSAGGLGARVDTRTGTIVEARHGYLAMELSVDPLHVHPDTGAPIAGVRLPWWNESRALVERAHRALDALAIVGWDVGLTPDGPILVEANARPGLDLSQRWEDGPVTTGAYGRCIAEHLKLGRHLPRAREDDARESAGVLGPPAGWSFPAPGRPPAAVTSADETTDSETRRG